MAQDKGKAGTTGTGRGPTPNRDRRREPQILEGKAVEIETPNPVVPDAATPDPVTPEPVSPEPVIPKPVPFDPVSAESKSFEPKSFEPKSLERKSPEPVTPDPVIEDPPRPESGTSQPAAAEASVDPEARSAFGTSETEPSVKPDGSTAAAEPEPATTTLGDGNGAARERLRRGTSYEPLRAPTPKSSLFSAATGLSAAALLVALASLYIASTQPDADTGAQEIADLRQQSTQLSRRVGALESRPAAAAPPAANLGPLTDRLTALEARTESLRSAVQTAPATPRIDIGPLERRLEALETRPQPTLDTSALENRVARLDEALAAPKTSVRATEAPNSIAETPTGDAAAVAVVAENLRRKLDDGRPFARELAALDKLKVAPDRLERLKGLADKGALTAPALSAEFTRLAPAMMRTGTGSADDNFLDRLARNATSLVRIRPVGEAEGDTRGALVSRIESALARGDVAAAVSTWDLLPGDAKGPSRDWANRARIRAQADDAVRQILDEAIDRLGRSQ